MLTTVSGIAKRPHLRKHPVDTLHDIASLPFNLNRQALSEVVERVTGRRRDPVTGKIYHMKFSPPESEEVADCWHSLGTVFKDGGEYGRALECYRKGLAILEKRVGPEDISLAPTYGNMANVFERQGEHEQALEH